MDERTRRCPLCGGVLHADESAIPYVLKHGAIVIVKRVPAERCYDCSEPFTSGVVTDRITNLLHQVNHLRSEVVVISYTPLDTPTEPAVVLPHDSI